MNEKTKKELIKRFKALGWRCGMMFVAGGIDIVLNNLAGFNMPNGATIVIGLILGEISKWVNNYVIELKAKKVELTKLQEKE